MSIRRLRFVFGTFAAALLLFPAACATHVVEAPAAASRPVGSAALFRALDLPDPNGRRGANGRPGHGYWQQQADYAIEARLDAEKRTVSATSVMTYRNRSPDALAYLWVHLEQNLYESCSVGRAVHVEGRYGTEAGFEGGCRLASVKCDGKPLAYRVYGTLARVELAAPVAAKDGVVKVEFAWTFEVPRYGTDRLGTETVSQGEIFQFAQWFPAVVKYDDVRGWNALPYLGAGEFYTDYGDYDVRLTVPRGMLVAAGAPLGNPDEVLTRAQRARLEQAAKSRTPVAIVAPNEVGGPAYRPGGDGPTTWRFRAENRRTFAWAASEAFAWDACGTGDVLCQSFYPSEAVATWAGPAGSSDMLAFSIEHYGAKWAPYPYPVATNVNGPVGGMEYPGIVFCSEREDEYQLWLVTTHEIGHSWFPMLVNTDERRHAWMDEGFNTFQNVYATAARYPHRAPPPEFPGLIDGWFEAARYRAYLKDAARPAVDTAPDRMAASYVGWSQYAHPAVGLVLLREEILGPERFDAALREYCAAWSFKSPQPADFFRVMENAAGMDLAWFWRGWFLERAVCDFTLGAASMLREEDGRWAASVTVRNAGGLPAPALWRATATDGSELSGRVPPEAWAARDDYEVAVRFPSGAPLGRFALDPDRRLPDVDRTDDDATYAVLVR